MMLELLRALPAAIGMTVLVTALALFIGTILAIPLMLARVSKRKSLRLPATAIIELVRGLPPIVWLFIVFFGIQFGTLRLSSFVAGLMTLSIVATAYLAEIFRVGYASVNKGQFEAANALGMSRLEVFIRVVAPQSFRVSLPAITTYGIALLKDSSIVSTIGLSEIVFVSTAVARVSQDATIPFLIAAILYLLLSLPFAAFSRLLDSNLRSKVAKV